MKTIRHIFLTAFALFCMIGCEDNKVDTKIDVFQTENEVTFTTIGKYYNHAGGYLETFAMLHDVAKEWQKGHSEWVFEREEQRTNDIDVCCLAIKIRKATSPTEASKP